MGGAVTAVGLGLSAVGTINQISAQKRQAEARKAQLQQQSLLAQEQLALSRQQFEQNKALAETQFEQEQEIIKAQEDQARKQLEAQKIEQQNQLLQTRAAAEQVEFQAAQRAANIVGQAEAQSVQNLDQQTALNERQQQVSEAQQGLAEQEQQARETQRQRDAEDQSLNSRQLSAVNPDAVEQQQDATQARFRLSENASNLEEQRIAQREFADDRAKAGQVAARRSVGAISSQRGLQEEMFAAQNELNKQNIDFQTARNIWATGSARFANEASRSAQQSATAIDTSAQIAQNKLQASQVRTPNFLDFAAGAANVAGQAVQSGLLSSSRQPQPATTFSTTNNLSFINPTQGNNQSFGNPTGFSSDINLGRG